MQLNIKMRKQRAGNFKEIRFPGGEKVKRHFQINFGESSIRFTAVIPNTHLSINAAQCYYMPAAWQFVSSGRQVSRKKISIGFQSQFCFKIPNLGSSFSFSPFQRIDWIAFDCIQL